MTPERNRRIILTGASAGIGKGLALEYGRRKERILLVARREELLREVAAQIRELGGEAAILALDVTEPDAADRIIACAIENFGGVDLAILNAALGGPTWAEEFDAGLVERMLDVNYVSLVRLIAALLPRMIAENQGQIVAISSLAAYRGLPGSGAYNASKAAVTVLMESLRTELRPTGVALTTILPGFVRTEMTAQNEFSMPLLMEPDRAARKIARAIDARRSEYSFPLPVSLAIRLLRILPNAIYDRLVLWGRSSLLRKR